MPNGGPDNCSTCGFNRCNRGIWRNPTPDETVMPFCEIRGLQIFNDHWTYCENWHTHSRDPVGPVYASGLYESGYRRIPWHGPIEPEEIGRGTCHICSGHFSNGLSIARPESAPLEFCSNQHYLQWWKSQHPGEDAPMSWNVGEEGD